ncbi:MAG TPA: DUF4339 domain-containing protein, partial [Polyangiaceae bacterium]
MNVACTACPAKYAVPDDKVRGKRARITCKHCGTAILIDGTSLGSASGDAAPAPSSSRSAPSPSSSPGVLSPSPVNVTPVSEAAATRAGPPGPAAEPPQSETPSATPWTVALRDGQQTSASTEQLLELYAAGAVDAETYVWREGMADWKRTLDVPELASLFPAPALPRTEMPAPPAPEEEATVLFSPRPSE